MTRITQENQMLRAEASSVLTSLPPLVEAVKDQTRALVARERVSMIDVKGIGKPEKFKNEEGNFLEWARGIEDFVVNLEPTLEAAMDWALEQETVVTSAMIDIEFGPDATDQIVNMLCTTPRSSQGPEKLAGQVGFHVAATPSVGDLL